MLQSGAKQKENWQVKQAECGWESKKVGEPVDFVWGCPSTHLQFLLSCKTYVNKVN